MFLLINNNKKKLEETIWFREAVLYYPEPLLQILGSWDTEKELLRDDRDQTGRRGKEGEEKEGTNITSHAQAARKVGS